MTKMVLSQVASLSTLQEIAAEREVQRLKHPKHTLDLSTISDHEKYIILAEEFGEVARALTYDNGSHENLRDELVQMVALGLAWLDGINEC